jgi:PAS domain S-box-containing protein
MFGIFDLSRFMPHGFCLAWDPGLIWLTAGSDLLIAAAYFSIPAALLLFLRRRQDLAFRPVFALFACFILACGTTHVLGAATLWLPLYWIQAWVDALTAGLSVATAITLWPLLPKALALPSPAAIQRVNDALARQVRLHDQAVSLVRASETRQKRLYARTPAALHATDAEGVLLDVSDRWLELTGYTRDQVIGRNVASFYTPESVRDFATLLARFREGHDTTLAERQFLRRDGTIRDIEVRFEPERAADGKLQRILAAVTDITERKEAEAALRATEAHLRQAQKMEAVGQLTGGIAHDFNNLLTTIMGSLELLQQRAALDDRGVRLAANALEGSRRAARLTSQLLTFSRRQRLAPEPLMPGDIIEGIHELLARTLGESIALEVGLPAEPWPLLADRNQMESALLNLVINARDAIESHGVVRIEVANRMLSAADIGQVGGEALAPGAYVSVAVIDTGCGMSDDVRARAFEPFFTTKGPGAGTGLGLSQTYGFVSQSGGTVTLDSVPGRGTRIELLLPRAAGAAAAPKPAETAVARRGGQGEHILLVEDDVLLRQTMADALRGRGYAVTTAGDGEQALQLLDDPQNATRYALLFTDVVMPGRLNGVELALAARERRPALPVLFATGYSAATLLDAWPEQVDLLAKPYSPEDVASRIACKLGLREAV